MPKRRQTSASKTRRREPLFAAVWHVGWAAVTAAGASLMVAYGLLSPGLELAALSLGVAAAFCGAGLALAAGGPGRVIAILAWGLAGGAAALMTGGVAGPLAAWCLAPLAAAAAFRRPRLLALGTACAIAATAVAALGGRLLDLPLPPPQSAVWLSFLSITTIAGGLGAGLVALQGAARRAERALENSHSDVSRLLDHQPQLLLSLQLDGRILAAYGQAPVGFEASALASRSRSELAAPEDRLGLHEALQATAEEGAAEVGFAPAHDPQGWLVISLRRMDPLRLTAAVRDGRPQRRRESELEEARTSAEAQNAGKSRFLANMSHELRTPLNAIMGFSDIMRQRLFGPLADRYAEYAELIHESGTHLLELINDVLDMSKIEAERFELARESFDARDAVSAVLRLMRGQADRAGIHLRGVLPADPLDAEADRRAVKQIALNLISNALKFTPRGGSVTLTAQACGDVLELVVADTGIGIAPRDLERLGRPYEQAGDADQRAAGAGLGLSLVRAFARLHGGDMAIESTVGEGTTVTVRLPVLGEPLPRLARADAAER